MGHLYVFKINSWYGIISTPLLRIRTLGSTRMSLSHRLLLRPDGLVVASNMWRVERVSICQSLLNSNFKRKISLTYTLRTNIILKFTRSRQQEVEIHVVLMDRTPTFVFKETRYELDGLIFGLVDIKVPWWIGWDGGWFYTVGKKIWFLPYRQMFFSWVVFDFCCVCAESYESVVNLSQISCRYLNNKFYRLQKILRWKVSKDNNINKSKTVIP